MYIIQYIGCVWGMLGGENYMWTCCSSKYSMGLDVPGKQKHGYIHPVYKQVAIRNIISQALAAAACLKLDYSKGRTLDSCLMSRDDAGRAGCKHTHTRRGEDHLKPRAAMCTRKFTCSWIFNTQTRKKRGALVHMPREDQLRPQGTNNKHLNLRHYFKKQFWYLIILNNTSSTWNSFSFSTRAGWLGSLKQVEVKN
jgi:hypothetical protein